MKLYKAIVSVKGTDRQGERVEVLAESLAEARAKLEAEYGEGQVLDLHNDEDANRPR